MKTASELIAKPVKLYGLWLDPSMAADLKELSEDYEYMSDAIKAATNRREMK